jgi:hypothetical protein
LTRNATFEIGTDWDSPVSLDNSDPAPFAGNATLGATARKDLKRQTRPISMHDKARAS